MSAAVTATITSKLTVQETLPADLPGGTGAVITHNGLDTAVTLNGASSQPVSQTAFFSQDLTAGTATLDLTAIPGTNGGVVNGTGLKVQLLKLSAPATNANPISLTFGAANPYNLLGATWQVTLSPGMELLFNLAGHAPVIGGGVKEIDISGVAAQTVNIGIALG